MQSVNLKISLFSRKVMPRKVILILNVYSSDNFLCESEGCHLFPLQKPNFFKQIHMMEDHQHNDLSTLSRSKNIPIVSITKTLSQNVV